MSSRGWSRESLRIEQSYVFCIFIQPSLLPVYITLILKRFVTLWKYYSCPSLEIVIFQKHFIFVVESVFPVRWCGIFLFYLFIYLLSPDCLCSWLMHNFLLFIFRDRISPYNSSCCPGTCSVDQVGLKLTKIHPPASAFWVVWLKVHHHHLPLIKYFKHIKIYSIIYGDNYFPKQFCCLTLYNYYRSVHYNGKTPFLVLIVTLSL